MRDNISEESLQNSKRSRIWVLLCSQTAKHTNISLTNKIVQMIWTQLLNWRSLNGWPPTFRLCLCLMYIDLSVAISTPAITNKNESKKHLMRELRFTGSLLMIRTLQWRVTIRRKQRQLTSDHFSFSFYCSEGKSGCLSDWSHHQSCVELWLNSYCV